jgi:hypothetical protein
MIFIRVIASWYEKEVISSHDVTYTKRIHKVYISVIDLRPGYRTVHDYLTITDTSLLTNPSL